MTRLYNIAKIVKDFHFYYLDKFRSEKLIIYKKKSIKFKS